MREPRLYVDEPLAADMVIALADERAHYLRNVMRIKRARSLRLFNGRDGEWRGVVLEIARNRVLVRLTDRLRTGREKSGPLLLMAAIKRPRLEWLIEKAVELGVGEVRLVRTEHAVVEPDSGRRLRAKIIEASEQCERLSLPLLHEPQALESVVGEVEERPVLFADERGEAPPLLAALDSLSEPLLPALLVGPEGGFSHGERRWLRMQEHVRPASLGGLILRSETAALCMLAVCMAARSAKAPTGGGGE